MRRVLGISFKWWLISAPKRSIPIIIEIAFYSKELKRFMQILIFFSWWMTREKFNRSQDCWNRWRASFTVSVNYCTRFRRAQSLIRLSYHVAQGLGCRTFLLAPQWQSSEKKCGRKWVQLENSARKKKHAGTALHQNMYLFATSQSSKNESRRQVVLH